MSMAGRLAGIGGRPPIGGHSGHTGAWDGGTLIHFYNLYGSFINIAAIPLNLEILCLRLDAPVVVQLWLKPRDHSKLASS